MHSIREFFKLEERKTNVRTEVVAGITTFLTMSYIIFLQPALLAGSFIDSNGVKYESTGMPIDALLIGVCVAAAFGSVLMGLWANYPIALAPGMGENFFFLTVIGGCVSLGVSTPETAWQTALGVVFLSGLIFLILSFLNIREIMMNSISPSMKHSMACGIGLFIALIGFQKGGLIHTTGGVYTLNYAGFDTKTALIFFTGLIVISVLHVLKIKGSVLWGILSGALVALLCKKIEFNGFIQMPPPSIGPIFVKMDLTNVFANIVTLLPFIIIFTFMDVFDTLGTIVGVTTQSGLMKDNKLPNAKRAFAADSIGTVFGVFCGQSTVTSYVESSTGVEYGGRTGLTAVTTGICFLLAVLFAPIIKMIGQYPGENNMNPIIAPALVIVGAIMMQSVKHIKWDDFSESVPAFLIIAGIPFTYSIADGLTLGFIAYPLIKLFGGKWKEAGWLTYVIGLILLLYVIFVKPRVG